MKYLIFLLFFSSFTPAVFSQERQVYKINPGESPEEAMKPEVRFMYPEFKAGIVQFRNGNFGASKMNYSFLHHELQFINGADTLALDKGEDINYVVIEKDSFYYRDKQWIRQMTSTGKVRMAELKFLAFANREKIGAFGQVNSGSSVDAIENMVTVSNITKQLQANQIVTFAMNYNYYFSDKYDNYRIANKKNIGNMFGNKCPGIEKFLESEKFNYHSTSDMMKIFDFINENSK